MLWYKAWLDTRWRLLIIFAVIFFVLYQVRTHAGPHLTGAALLAQLQFMWMIIPLSMGGAGVRTEAPFRPIKGVQGSCYFTLSLPVSRVKLLCVRAGIGLIETGAIMAVSCAVATVVFPVIRDQIALPDGIRYLLTIFVCAFAGFGISTVLATFLDQQWQGIASMLLVLFGRSIVFGLDSPAKSPYDFFRVVGNASPLFTHSIPWTAMCVSAAIGAICMAAAAKIERVRQY